MRTHGDTLHAGLHMHTPPCMPHAWPTYRLKSQVSQECSAQESSWRHVNQQTQEAMVRLDAAQNLVRSLGIGVSHGGGSAGL